MTPTFYAPPESLRSGRVVLPEEEARHAARVLRKQQGDEIVVVDGEGGWHRVILDHVDVRTAAGRIVETRTDQGEPTYDLTLGVGLIKNRGRFETFLEKAVELGVSRIAPLFTERTQKERLRQWRAHNLLVAAMKQCGRSRLIALDEPVAFEQMFNRKHDVVFCCHEAPGGVALNGALQDHQGVASMLILIGPEGGFTDAEVRAATEAGAVVVSLGPRRLRTETAAITAAAAVMLSGR